MSSTLLVGPKSHVPRALAMSMPSGFIEAASSPAISVFPGVLGTMAANIRQEAPIQEIIGSTARWLVTGSQWNMLPRARAVTTRYPSPRSRMNRGSRSLRRA